MKKCLSLFMVLVLVFSLTVPAMAAETDSLPTITLTADKEIVNPGETITLTLASESTVTNLLCFGYKIFFDESHFEVTETQAGTVSTGNITVGDTGTDKNNTQYHNGYHIVVNSLSFTGDAVTLSPGTIATITLKAKENACGEADFVLYQQSLTDYDVYTEYESNLVNNAANVKVGYTVTVSASENGSVTADKILAAANDTITLTPAAAEGYELDAITVTDASGAAVTVTDNQFTMPASNVTVAATFKATQVTPTTYAVNIAEGIENGSVTADKTEAAEGETVTLTATPADGYELDAITVTDASGTEVAVTDNSFTMPTSNVTVAATFKATVVTPTTYTVTVAENIENGSVTADVTEAAEGATVTLTATPAEGYELEAITVTDASGAAVAVTDNTFTMPASNVTVSATFKAIPVVTAGYSVTASTDVSITAGEDAEVSITVTESDSKAYNAYMLNIAYPEGLTYVSASGSGVEGDTFQANHDSTNRIIQIIGYGADKASGTAAATLTFTGSTAGEYDVPITSAKVDAAAAAPTQDTPDATITYAATKITITGYTVNLGDGLTAESEVANPGEDYTFKATDADNYDYTVTAKIGDDEITVTDNGDGTYTIPADQITGNISVTATKTAKTYDVTYDGTTTENAATYNTDYVFTPEQEGYTVGGVTITIGGDAYTSYSNVDGTYTIPGADITGDIVITIDWVQVTPEDVTVTPGTGISGSTSATPGTDYTFSFGETDKYDYDEDSLVVKVGETDITEKVTKNEETGVYTIPGDLITDDITISVERTEKVTFTVEVSEYLTLNEGSKMYLVTVKGVEEGKVAKYDGQSMFWSAETLTTGENGEETTGYGAYAWLVISNEGLEAVKTAASENVTTAEGTTDLTVDYSGDVNGTTKVDVNDAQLVYNMYNAYYGDFNTVNMQKFLDADVNSDMTVNVEDAAAVVNVIINQ